jgi:hypothetical protein
MIFRSVVSLLVCLQLVSFMPSRAGSQSPGVLVEKWWYNFPSSPLTFEPTNSDASMLDLRRASLPGEKILSYRLGCLLMSNGRVQITKRLEPKGRTLESGHDYFASSSIFKDEMRACPGNKPLLAVIEVCFADGGVWAIETVSDGRASLPDGETGEKPGEKPGYATQRTSKASRVDQLLDTPRLRGVASVRVGSTTFIAVWTETPQDQTLEIYGMRISKYPAVQLIDEFKDHGFPWQSLTAIQDGAVAGFQVRRTTGESWFGATMVYFYVGGRFKKVFESGDEAELFDLTGDGYPEALEYQGDKADPASKVKISVWKNNRYQYLTTVPVTELYSSETRSKITRFLQSAAERTGSIKAVDCALRQSP